MSTRGPVDEDLTLAGWAIAGLGPLVVAALLVPIRTDLDNTNLALILVIVVVLAAIAGGRGPAALAAVVATMSYDFFLTKPYLSLRIDSADDLETTLILLAIGLIVGQLVVIGRRHRAAADRGASEVRRLRRVADQIATGASTDDVMLTAQAELTDLLALRDCRFERVPFVSAYPRLERNGVITGASTRRFAREEFTLPEEGVELEVLARGRLVGRFVMFPLPGVGASLEERVVAVAITDQLGSVLAGAEENHG